MSFDDMSVFRLSPFAQSARAKRPDKASAGPAATAAGPPGQDPNAAQNAGPGIDSPGRDSNDPGNGQAPNPNQAQKAPGGKRPGAKGGPKMPFGPPGGGMEELSSLNQQLASLADSMWGDVGNLPGSVGAAVLDSANSIASNATSLSDAMDRLDRLMDLQSSVTSMASKSTSRDGKSQKALEAELIQQAQQEDAGSDVGGADTPQMMAGAAGAKGAMPSAPPQAAAPPAPPVAGAPKSFGGGAGMASAGAMMASLPSFGAGKLNFRA